MKYNEEADAELERLYNSVGAVTDSHKYHTLFLALGYPPLNTPKDNPQSVDVSVMEMEYLMEKQLVTSLTAL